MTRRSYSHGRARAKEIIKSLSIQHPSEIAIEEIAWNRGALVREDDLEGFEGRLLRSGRSGIITVKSSIRESGKKRWVAAHELGHFELHKDTDQIALCTNRDLLYFYRKVQPTEGEANEFAGEILMPESLLIPLLGTRTPRLDLVGEIAAEFGTTLTASAVRYVDSADHRCAIVMSTDSAIDWCHPSTDFGYWPKKGTPLSVNSYAVEFFSGGQIADKMQAVPADAWLTGDKIRQGTYINEHSRALSRYGAVLTLLWIEDDIDGYYDEEEEPADDPRYFTEDGKRWKF